VKNKTITKIKILANRPTNRYKDALNYKKGGHNKGSDLSFIIIIVADMS
jgi:hypothetical protein